MGEYIKQANKNSKLLQKKKSKDDQDQPAINNNFNDQIQTPVHNKMKSNIIFKFEELESNEFYTKKVTKKTTMQGMPPLPIHKFSTSITNVSFSDSTTQ